MRVTLPMLALLAVLGIAGQPGAALASCAAPAVPHTRTEMLQQIAANAAGLVFVGSVVRRGPAFERKGLIYTPTTFAVAVGLRGVRARRLTVLTPGGTVGGTSQGVEDSPTYRSTGLNLVLAERASDGTLMDAGGCTAAGPASIADVRLLLRFASDAVVFDPRFAAPRLPMTGTNVTWSATSGLALLVIGGLLLRLGRHTPGQQRIVPGVS